MFFRVLGPVEIEDEGKPLPLGGARRRALVAALLMHPNEVVPRDVLIDAIWGGHSARDAYHSLESLVSRVRGTLHARGEEVLLTRRTGYMLRLDADEFDVFRFERLLEDGRAALRGGDPATAAAMLRGALGLWRGRPFEDVLYASFAQAEVERLEESRLVALEERIEADLALGSAAELVAELESVARKYPQRERLRGQLMLSLYRSGRQSEALGVYQDTRRELVEQLGIEPGSTLRRLEQAILQQDPELDLAHKTPAPPLIRRARRVDSIERFGGRRRRFLLGLISLGLAAAAGGIAIALLSGIDSGLRAVPVNSVGVIDPRSTRIVAAIPVGQHPTEVAAGSGAVWVANFNSGTLGRIGLRSRKTEIVTNAGGTPTGLAVGDGAVWVSNGFADRVIRVDERSGRVTATIPMRGHPGPIVVNHNGVWVLETFANLVAKVDPGSLQPTMIRVGLGPSGIAAGDGSIWVANGLARTLTQIDSMTGVVVRPAIALRCAPAQVAFGAGAVWVTCTTADEVVRIDPRTGQDTSTIQVGRGPTGIAIVDDRVWVADTYGREVSEINPAQGVDARTVSVVNIPEGLASAGGELWLAVYGF